MKYQTKARNFTTNLKIKAIFCLPELIETKIVTCKFHADDFTVGRYDMILYIELLTVLLLYLKIFKRFIKRGGVPCIYFTYTMVIMCTYEYKN